MCVICGRGERLMLMLTLWHLLMCLILQDEKGFGLICRARAEGRTVDVAVNSVDSFVVKRHQTTVGTSKVGDVDKDLEVSVRDEVGGII